MARRKNVKRIDPRYFLHETVNRGEELEEPAEAEETALNSPREAGRQWSYENIVNTVGDLVREALEGHDLDADSIRDAIAEALDEELGPVKDEGPLRQEGTWYGGLDDTPKVEEFWRKRLQRHGDSYAEDGWEQLEGEQTLWPELPDLLGQKIHDAQSAEEIAQWLGLDANALEFTKRWKEMYADDWWFKAGKGHDAKTADETKHADSPRRAPPE